MLSMVSHLAIIWCLLQNLYRSSSLLFPHEHWNTNPALEYESFFSTLEELMNVWISDRVRKYHWASCNSSFLPQCEITWFIRNETFCVLEWLSVGHYSSHFTPPCCHLSLYTHTADQIQRKNIIKAFLCSIGRWNRQWRKTSKLCASTRIYKAFEYHTLLDLGRGKPTFGSFFRIG